MFRDITSRHKFSLNKSIKTLEATRDKPAIKINLSLNIFKKSLRNVVNLVTKTSLHHSCHLAIFVNKSKYCEKGQNKACYKRMFIAFPCILY